MRPEAAIGAFPPSPFSGSRGEQEQVPAAACSMGAPGQGWGRPGAEGVSRSSQVGNPAGVG